MRRRRLPNVKRRADGAHAGGHGDVAAVRHTAHHHRLARRQAEEGHRGQGHTDIHTRTRTHYKIKIYT